MTFDATINLGHILTFVGMVGGGFAAAIVLRGQVTEIIHRVSLIERELEKMTEVLVAIGRQDEKVAALDRRIDEIQRRCAMIHESRGLHADR